jgi:hypothetical protein
MTHAPIGTTSAVQSHCQFSEKNPETTARTLGPRALPVFGPSGPCLPRRLEARRFKASTAPCALSRQARPKAWQLRHGQREHEHDRSEREDRPEDERERCQNHADQEGDAEEEGDPSNDEDHPRKVAPRDDRRTPHERGVRPSSHRSSSRSENAYFFSTASERWPLSRADGIKSRTPATRPRAGGAFARTAPSWV